MTKIIFTLLLFLLLCFQSSALAEDKKTFLERCKQRFHFFDRLVQGQGPGIDADVAQFRESQNYPLEIILQGLKFNPVELDSQTTVLSLGEGKSPLLIYMLRFGLRVKGLDKNYPNTTIAEYQREYGNVLIRANAARTRFPENSFDFTVSYGMVNNLNLRENIAVINEALRVVKPGVENIRLNGYSPKYLPHITEYLHESYGRQISFGFESIPQEWVGQNGVTYRRGGILLEAEKRVSHLRKTEAPIPDEMDPDVRLKM